MIYFDIPKRIRKDITDEILNELSNNKPFTVNTNERFGRYITYKDDSTVKYIIFSNPHNHGRNSRLAQFFNPAYNEYLNDTNENKELIVYVIPCEDDNDDYTNYAKLLYRMYATIGATVIVQKYNVTKFVDQEDFNRFREENRRSHKSNQSSYIATIEDEGNACSYIYGKIYGANERESILMAVCTKELSKDKPAKFIRVKDHGLETLCSTSLNILDKCGIELCDFMEEFNSNESNKVKRNQFMYIANLITKYGSKKCIIKEFSIESLNIASHAERVCDILSNPLYSNEEKMRRLIDPDNGLFLTPILDKMFENGYFYFDGQYVVVNEKLSEQDKKIVRLELGDFTKIPDEYYNENMHQYMEIHRKRIFNEYKIQES